MALKNFIKITAVLAACFGGLYLSSAPVLAATTPITCPVGSTWKGHENEVDANGNLKITQTSQCYMPLDKTEDTLMSTVQTIVNVIIGVIGVIAVVVIVIGGVYYIISQGEAAKITKAKNTLLYGVIGLIVALLAYAIINFILKSVFA